MTYRFVGPVLLFILIFVFWPDEVKSERFTFTISGSCFPLEKIFLVCLFILLFHLLGVKIV